jgi:nitric oxide reductase NorD protein
VSEPTEQTDKSLTGLARNFGKLSAEKKRAALEVSASLAGVSLRVSREFVEAVPSAANVLSADDIRSWGELGRRLAMGKADTGASFFAAGVDALEPVTAIARTHLFDLCGRQLVLSSATALDTYKRIPAIAAKLQNKQLLERTLELAVEIAKRSAKHSHDFVVATAPVFKALSRFKDDHARIAEAVFPLVSEFALRTGGMAAELWARLPDAFAELDAGAALRLLERTKEFLDLGGSVTLHFVTAGNAVLQNAPAAFEAWSELAEKVGSHGNAVLISFLRATPQTVSRIAKSTDTASIARVFGLLSQIALIDAESALAAYRSSSQGLSQVPVSQFEDWIERGIERLETEPAKSRRSYFALETRESNSVLTDRRQGLPLERVQHVLRLYIEALTGKEIEVEAISAASHESRIGDGRTIYLPTAIAEFDDDEMDFRLYKVLAAHGAGQIEFGTFAVDSTELRAAFAELDALYSATADERDAFSLAGYLGETESEELEQARELPVNSDYRAVLNVFPEPSLARKVFATMENARIDHRLRSTYRGLRKDLELMQQHLRKSRPYIFDVPAHLVPFELLFQITLCGGATDDARQFYSQVVSEIETTIERFLQLEAPTVADSLMATSRVYDLFQNISGDTAQVESETSQDDQREFAYEDVNSAEGVTEDKVERERQTKKDDVRELFTAWNSSDEETEPDDLSGSEAWANAEAPEQALEADDVAFAYDEWDRDLNDYRVGWSRVIEKKVKKGDRTFVEIARSRYRGVISSIRHQFQLMKPENLTRINRELDGEDYDLNALVDYVIDKRADGQQSENIYTKRLRRQRDVAVSILLDQSSSTARTITRNPLQPYTHPGRRIIEIEKEGLVLMSEALEAVGDIYSIYGFTSEGRRNVKFYVVKDFGERYSEEVESRIGGITFQNNTRLGAAIRHASHKLARQEARTKLLIVLTDGRPYDHDYGDARYAREDVREALIEAKTTGITPFCITIDRESESELKDLYGNVGYTIIDDVMSLPERMPNIYRRLTT